MTNTIGARARFSFWALCLLCGSLISGAAAAESPALRKISFQIDAPSMTQALLQFTEQSQLQLAFTSGEPIELPAPKVVGEFTPEEALNRLLANTGLRYEFVNDRTIAVSPVGKGAANLSQMNPIRLVQTAPVAAVDAAEQTPSRPATNTTAEPRETGDRGPISEILVRGSKVLNMDIRRTRDDIQPYVTFDRTTIANSGAVDLNDFLKQRLTMNTTGLSNVQNAGSQLRGASSEINLRGVGATKTLILVDGRRVAAPSFNNGVAQANINTIPINAVERVEVLPATSAGIYGGSATGGVINIILRRDYTGMDVKLSYDNTFDSDSAMRRADLAAGWSLAGGRTNILVSGSSTRSNGMVADDRDQLQRARELTLANNPSFMLNPAAPAIGSTANIASANGANLVLKNGTALNSLITFAPVGYAGAASDNGAALVANAGRYNFETSYTGQISAASPALNGGKKTLMQASELDSAMMTLRQTFSSKLDGYLSLMASDQRGGSRFSTVTGLFTLPASVSTNPFQQAILVRTPNPDFQTETTNTNSARTINAGLIANLPGRLALSLDFGWSRAGLSFDFPNGFLSTAGTNAATSGALDILRDPNVYPTRFAQYLEHTQYAVEPFKNTIQSSSLRFSKPLFRLPAGDLGLSGLVEYRDEKMDEGGYYQASSTSQVVFMFPSRSQSIASGYLETKIPLVSQLNRKPLVNSLDLQVALRRDEYEVNGSTGSFQVSATPPVIERSTNKLSSVDYTVGLMYSPIESLALRASYGTGFQPPTVSQVLPSVPGQITAANNILDIRRGNEIVIANNIGGGSPTVKPENSKSFTAGLIFSLGAKPDLRISVDYISIEQEGLIGSPPGALQGFVQFESLFPGRVQRAAVAPGDPYGVGRITFIDSTLVNLGAVNVEAYDVAIDWTTDKLPRGTLALAVLGTFQTAYEVQVVEGQPFLDSVGIGSTNPLDFKGNVSLTWSDSQWSLGWTARYFDSYLAANARLANTQATLLNQGNGGRVESQLYHDIFGRYKFGARAGTGVLPRFTENLEVQAGIRNLFNTDPPFDAGTGSTAFYSPYGDARLRSYWLSLGRNF